MEKNIPHNYFKTFPDKLEHKIQSLEDEIEKTAPFLSSLGKQEPYLLPKDYFVDSLQKIIAEKRTISTSKWNKAKQTAMALAALSLILISAIVLSTQNNNAEEAVIEFAEVMDLLEEDAYLLDDAEILDLADALQLENEAMMDVEDENEIELYLNYIINEMTDEELSELL